MALDIKVYGAADSCSLAIMVSVDAASIDFILVSIWFHIVRRSAPVDPRIEGGLSRR